RLPDPPRGRSVRVPPPRRNPRARGGRATERESRKPGGYAHPRRPAHQPQDDQLEMAGRQPRHRLRPRPAPATEADPSGRVKSRFRGTWPEEGERDEVDRKSVV